MKAHKLEMRIDAVIRWLERMKTEYRRGAVESAYIDAECARADLEDLRTNMFAGISPKTPGKSSVFPHAIVLAMIIVMVMVMPLSREKVPEYVPEPVALAVTVTPAEPVTPSGPETVQTSAKPRKSRKASVPKRVSQPTNTAMKTEPKPSKTVAYDKVYSLLQTGQRALKNDKSVIKVK